jgi:diaminopimelate epimerase
MHIWKLHALGNNFVFLLHDHARDYPKMAEILCRMDTAIGADGLLSVEMATDPPMVRMWNPDGTPDFCGNGLCCAAHLVRRLTERDVHVLATPIALVPVSIEPIDASTSRVAVRIEKADFDPRTIPLAIDQGKILGDDFHIRVADREFHVLPVNNGNMHTVIFVDDLPGDEVFLRYSPGIETHPFFPDRTNVLWCAVSDTIINMRIWERGVGETFSCGTGAAAAVAVCDRAGIVLPREVTVAMSGGSSQVSRAPTGVQLRTQVELVFEGKLIKNIW